MGFWETVAAVVVGYVIGCFVMAALASLVGWLRGRVPPSTRFYD